MFNPLHGSFARSVKQYENQADKIELMDELAEHNKAMRELAKQIKELLWFQTPQVKPWSDTITDVNMVKLRYEGRLHLYMLNMTASANVTLTTLGLQIPLPALSIGWVNMNYPEGSTLTATNAASRYPVIFVATNSIIGGVS